MHLPSTASTRSSRVSHVLITSSSTGQSSEASNPSHTSTFNAAQALTYSRWQGEGLSTSPGETSIQSVSSTYGKLDEEKLSLQHAYFGQDSPTTTYWEEPCAAKDQGELSHGIGVVAQTLLRNAGLKGVFQPTSASVGVGIGELPETHAHVGYRRHASLQAVREWNEYIKS